MMLARFITQDRLYRKVFWGWFALTLTGTVACYGGNRALPELLLAVSLLVMCVVWSIRVAHTGEPAQFGPRTPHLIAVGLLLWTAAFLVPLGRDTGASLSVWSAWGQQLNCEASGAVNAASPYRLSTLSIDPAASRHELRKLACYYLFFVLTMAHLRRWRDVRTMLAILVAVTMVEAIVGSAGILSGSRKYLWLLPNPVNETHRHFGTFVNANHAGTFLGMGLMLCIPLSLLSVALWARRAARSKCQKVKTLKRQNPSAPGSKHLTVQNSEFRLFPIVRFLAFALGGAALVVGLFLTNSHGALLATALPLLVLLILLTVRHPTARVPLMFLSAVALTVGFVVYRFLPEAERTLRVEKILDRGHWVAGQRPLLRRTIWEGSFTASAVAPWCGSGPGTFIDAYRPFDVTRKETMINGAHNTYLRVLVEQGLVGVALTTLGIGWLVCTLRPRSLRAESHTNPFRYHSRTSRVRSTLRLSLGAAIAVTLLHSVVDFPLQIPAIALIFVAIVAAAGNSSPQWRAAAYRPCERSRRLKPVGLVPWATVIASAILVGSSVQPLLATMHLSRTVSLQQEIERDAAGSAEGCTGAPVTPTRKEPEVDLLPRFMEHASALHSLRRYNSRAAAYGLKTRIHMGEELANLSVDRPESQSYNAVLLHDAMEMVRTNPFCVEARLAAATAAARTGNVRACLILSHQAQWLDGGHAETHYAAGRALVAAGAERHALIAFADSLNTSPRFVFRIADWVRERELHNEILALRIDDPRSLCWLAMNLPQADADTKQHVVAHLETMLNGDPRASARVDLPKRVSGEYGLTSAERLYLRGQIALWLEDRPVEAIGYFEQSLAIEPLLWIRWHLAQACRRAGREADADTELNAIYKQDPNYTPPERRDWRLSIGD